MARGKTLEDLLTSLRVECRISLNSALNIQVRDTHMKLLQRMQEWLWEDHDWPHLRVERYIETQNGQRYYDLSSCKRLENGELTAAGDLKIEKVRQVWVRDGNIWRQLDPGIGPDQYNAYNSDTDERSWPPERWSVSEDEQIEIWPIPGLDGDTDTLVNMIKVVGYRNLGSLVSESDTADLDDRVLTLLVAAELLDGEDAQKKLSLGNRRLAKLLGSATAVKKFRMFGQQAPKRRLRGPPTVYYRTDS